MGVSISARVLLIIWLAVCAGQDYRTGKVSNWLTLPALILALLARLMGWLVTPWLLIAAISLISVLLWRQGLLGGADAKGWLVFSMLGEQVLLAATIGIVTWYLALLWIGKRLGLVHILRIPGFLGYALGLTLIVVVPTISC